jgi:predicted membrane-bound spermidine synthase
MDELDGTCLVSRPRNTRTPEQHLVASDTISEGTSEIQQLVVSRAASDLRIE